MSFFLLILKLIQQFSLMFWVLPFGVAINNVFPPDGKEGSEDEVRLCVKVFCITLTVCILSSLLLFWLR